LPMATNLHRSAGPLVVSSRSRRSEMEPLLAAGALWADTPAAFDKCNIVLLCLPGGSEIRATLFGPDRPRFTAAGTLFIDVGTTSHRETLAIASELRDSGHEFVDAPVSGMAARAAAGTLTTMVGASADLFARVSPVLSAVAS